MSRDLRKGARVEVVDASAPPKHRKLPFAKGAQFTVAAVIRRDPEGPVTEVQLKGLGGLWKPHRFEVIRNG